MGWGPHQMSDHDAQANVRIAAAQDAIAVLDARA
jgi:hypothetical protein